jgi:hypothetical protein
MRSRLALIACWCVTVAASPVLAGEPVVVSTAPVRNTVVAAGTTVSVTFDEPVLPASINAGTFRVFGRTSGTASGPLALSNANQTVTLTPSHPFAAGEVVLVNLSHSIQAADTTPLRSAGYAFQFSIQAGTATRQFDQIDVMSNRILGGQTRIYGAAATDLDGDGWVDLATVNEVSADLRIFMNRADGSGMYDPFLKPPFPIGVESSPNEPADFDNDGKTDIVTSATISGGVWISRGAGDGTFSGSQSVLTGSQPHGVAVLDVDGDADLDIVNAVAGDDHMALTLNNGAGAFGPPSFFEGGGGTEYGLGSGDMNNDGITDLVIGAAGTETLVVQLGNGNGTFTGAPAQDAGGVTWQVAVGDVDGDGNLDAALGNSFSNNGAILRGNGDGTMDLPEIQSMPGHTPASDLGDLDGDGDLDWMLSSFGAGVWHLFVNDGNGNFTFDQEFEADSNPSCAIFTDFDNDGDLDLALTDEIADLVTLMRNSNGPSPLCPPAPVLCRTPTQSAAAVLQIKNRTPDTKDGLLWRWNKGAATMKAEYGNPVTTDDYALCLYDAGALVASATADAGSGWTEKPTSFAHKNPDLLPDGTHTVQLRQGLFPGTAKILFKGKGGPLGMPAPDALAGPVTVQLHRSGGGPCWGATYSAPFQRQDGEVFMDRSD